MTLAILFKFYCECDSFVGVIIDSYLPLHRVDDLFDMIKTDAGPVGGRITHVIDPAQVLFFDAVPVIDEFYQQVPLFALFQNNLQSGSPCLFCIADQVIDDDIDLYRLYGPDLRLVYLFFNMYLQ